MKLVWDCESANLLNSSSIDYNASPFKLRDSRFVHCAGFKEHGTEQRFMFEADEIYNGRVKEFILDTATELIGHNTINFDHLLLKMAIGLDYSIGCSKLGIPDTVGGKPIIITDTLVMSKTFNPDRPQHSIDYFGSILGLEKINWRAKAIELGLIQATDPKGAEFRVYHPEMGVYMMRDIDVGERVYNWLIREKGDWDWTDSYELEKAVAEVITRQEHRGFWFDRDKAVICVKDLDTKMEELRELVEPLIPPKPLTKGDLQDVTPTAKQFKLKTGEPVVHILNFAKKHGGEFVQGEDGKWRVELYGKVYTLPLPNEPLFTHKPAKLDDTLHIKEWLVSLGWSPTQYKERDLTVDSKKKKVTKEKFDEAVVKWVDQTFASPFKADRLYELDYTPRITRELLIYKMQQTDHIKRRLMVYTNPTVTVGMEKEIDPKLLELSAKFQYAKEISLYLTYKHRRNSILGGGVDPDDDEDMQKGWMGVDRINEDHRIPTPADTCGAATSRFKHRVVANIPRVTSVYGENMRSLFGADVDDGFILLGYDFDSLEAKIESHYVFRYPGGPEYGVSLTAMKPHDCHTVLAEMISKLLGRKFPRGSAKNVKYGCSYNAQVKRVAKTVGCSLEDAQVIFDTFWEQAFPLKQLKEAMQAYWETKGQKKFLLGIDGRKLPIRSKGNVINTAFQSAGVICAKRAMVIHDRKLKAEGLSVDFFTEDWKNKDFCQQLIAMHDEAQSEIRKSQVTWKMFDSEEAAKAFKDAQTDKVWSDIGHLGERYYVGYCRAGELASEAVTESGEYYKLNVKLTAGYSLGRNWAETH
jgi:hypothetical protein